ncbi:hypothetical protein TEK04_16275 [Klenkia sp. LSe6-5]|uniref:Uncharacterized protein n=1 Tax=Klenkia sesuvii TaxID=3103137 RepID=A0ABU8DWQ5_9ACTN
MPRPPRTRHRRLRPALLRTAAVALCVGALSACELPDVSMSPALSAPTATATPARTTSAPATTAGAEELAAVVAAPATPDRPAGELDAGSVTHVLPAGDRQLVVDWWTTETATAWTATDPKTVQLSAHLEGGDPDAGIEVLVTRFSAVLDDGTTRADVVDDSGEFALQPPFTYGTVLSLPPSGATATSVTLAVQFDLLVETEPGSQRYFRQTVLDSLVLPVLPAPAEETP